MIPGFGLWLAANVYLVWRLGSIPAISRRLNRWVLAALLVLLYLSFVASRLVERTFAAPLAPTIEFIGMSWLGILLLVLTALLAAEIVTGFGFLFRRHAARIRGWALIAGLALSAFAFVQGFRAPVVRDYEVRLAGLPRDADGTVLVAVSDFHLGTLLGETWLAARIAQVERLKPDVVVALGDIVEGHGGAESTIVLRLRELRAPLGVWAVTGNHEHYGGRGARALEAAGFHVLHDTSALVRPGLIFTGVEDLTGRRHSGQADSTVAGTVARVLAARPAHAGATVLLTHSPLQVEEAARAGAGLMLAAHTHAGQIWPFAYLSRSVYPYNAGRYVVDGMPLIVCRGTGTWGPRMRLWRPSEILRITLRAA